MVIIRGRGRSQLSLVTALGQQPSYGAHGCVPCWPYSLPNAAFCWATEAWPAVPEKPSDDQVDGRIPYRPDDEAVGLFPLSCSATHCWKDDVPPLGAVWVTAGACAAGAWLAGT